MPSSTPASRLTATARAVSPPNADGFTLVELLVAIALTGLVVLLAHTLLAEVTSAARRVDDVAAAADRAGNRRLWLLRAFESIELNGAAGVGFRGTSNTTADGEADRVAFPTRVRAGNGQALVLLRLWLNADGRVLAELRRQPGASSSAPDTLVLAEGIRALGLDYLLDYGADARWVQEWSSPTGPPLAARLRLRRVGGSADTLLLYVGPRG